MKHFLLTCEQETRHAKCCCCHKWAVCSVHSFVSVFRLSIFKVFTHSCSPPAVFSSSLGSQTSALPVTDLLPKPWGYYRPINLSQIPTAARKLVRRCLRRIHFPPSAITVLKQGTYSQLRVCSCSAASRRLLGNSHPEDFTYFFHVPVVREDPLSHQRWISVIHLWSDKGQCGWPISNDW